MIKKLNKRTTRVTPEMNADAKKLLRLMGVPVVEAPCEAEAQCAILNKSGRVFAAGSEDMDTLTCGATVLVRRLTCSDARKLPIMEIHLDKVLKGLEITMEQFIDLCILLGCDYTDKIRGIGPKRALEFIKKFGSIEKILDNLDSEKYIVPDPFPYKEIRAYFTNPETIPAEQCDLTFSEPDEEGLINFLCKDKGFSEDRVRNGIDKIRKSKSKAVQARITSFFVVQKPAEASPRKLASPTKGAAKGVKASPASAKKRKLDSQSPVGSPQKKKN